MIELGSPTTDASPQNAIGRMETDVFCVHCHYNLHGQTVWRDERLDIPVCRCPECGKHHPAGAMVTAATKWMLRISSVVLLLWVGLLIAMIFGAGSLMFGMTMVYIEAYTGRVNITESQLISIEGPDVAARVAEADPTQRYFGASTNPADPVYYLRVPPDPKWNKVQYYGTGEVGYLPAALISFVSSAASAIIGLIGAVAMHHLSRRRAGFLIVVPLIVGVLAYFTIKAEGSYILVRPWMQLRVAMFVTLNVTVVFLMICFGRQLARGVVRTFVPHKLRGPLGFLWIADGKAPPVPVVRG